MQKKLAVIYVTGVGDANVSSQRRAVSVWRLWGVQAAVLQMQWARAETWHVKQARLLAEIDRLLAQDRPVALVGASAGAAAVVNAYAIRKDQLIGCVLIAGKVNHPETIGENYRRGNPDLLACVQACQQSLAELDTQDRKRILSRYALFDAVVPLQDSVIPGARGGAVPTAGHTITIALQLLFGAPSFLSFLKRLAKLRKAT